MQRLYTDFRLDRICIPLTRQNNSNPATKAIAKKGTNIARTDKIRAPKDSIVLIIEFPSPTVSVVEEKRVSPVKA